MTMRNGETSGDPVATATQPPRLALRPAEAAVALGLGRRLLWELTTRGEVPHVRLGRRILYPTADLQEWLTSKIQPGRPPADHAPRLVRGRGSRVGGLVR